MVEETRRIQISVRVTQTDVDVHRALKRIRVVFAQPLPLFVGAEGTKRATGTRHRERQLAILTQPVAAMPQSHLPLNERKHRLEPGIFRQPAADQLRAPALIISDGQIENHRYLTRGKLLTAFESQHFADFLYDGFEFVISSQLTDCARRINSV